MNPFFHVSDLNASYGDLQVLWGIRFEVSPSEIVAILGGNGAGKTTLLRSIAGLHRQRSGQIQFEGQDVSLLPPHLLIYRGLALVLDERGIFPDLTVERNLIIGSYSIRDSQKAASALAWIYQIFPILRERKKFLARSLSGGEQQMLALGKGMITRPRLLLLDEPSSGLSPLMVQRLMGCILKIHDEGTTVVLVEQNVRHALQTAHRAYVLENGRIVLEGQSPDLMNDPRIKKAYLGG
ncbi:MAG: ABC transporter ATP-binding protein [Thermodesulfobacteriota bacterium]